MTLTDVRKDPRPGGTVSYFMTDPDGDQQHGWWKVTAVEEPHRLVVEDGFADKEGTPDVTLPTMRFTVTDAG